MPTQWRTIAPIVGRTATQCLERYQQLLDEADAMHDPLGLAGPGAETAPSADDVRRLRPGEIDPDPETKPARPDAVDMDEEEKEMLSEARARLANTEGKKAKRKARERALEEARRLATLQKRREMKVAGIYARPNKKEKFHINYSAEIPFEKQPAPGFYDTAEENARTFDAPLGRTIGSMESNGRDVEQEKRKREAKAPKQPKHDDALRRLQEEEVVTKRRKLQLPEAHVGDRELEQIVKLGHAGNAARELVEGDAGAPTDGLLGEYATMEPPETPVTAPSSSSHDTLLREAHNLKRRTETQTPLLGDDNAALLETPSARAAPTPGAPGATPRTAVGATPGATPYRDSLGLNAEPSTPRTERAAQRVAKHNLIAALHALPRPKNDFELVVDADEAQPDAPAKRAVEEDAAERDARLAREAEEERQREFARRSQAVQRDLPRPLEVDAAALTAELASLEPDAVQREIDAEMVALMAHDARLYPQPGSRQPGGAVSRLAPIDDAALYDARQLVHAELAQELGFPGARPEALASLTRAQADALDAPLVAVRAASVWSAERHTYVLREDMGLAEVVRTHATHLDALRSRMQEQAAAAAKAEKTLGKLLGGYQARSKKLAGEITAAAQTHAEAALSLAAFERLALGEQGAARDRLERIQEAVGHLQRTEAAAQAEYRELDARRAEAQETYEALQTELDMRRAEQALMA
ncbi:Pre-mRNA-splicing factor cef1 [Malassezia furfur]|uniref:Pre-mRNA-splicing factor cef1 n=1 Tax=Malassezia furfur TaxID=55194 RepID=A0ABY8ETL9_MALFU|nr:Pre-mRNA-splicing factor cef1 [Malassezia furfur]